MDRQDRDYERLFAALPSPHLVVTPDLVVVDANGAYLGMVGRTRQELVGRPVFEVFPPTSDAVDEAGEPRLVRSFRRVLQTGKPDPSFVERYDVVDPASGRTAERWWSHVVVPVAGADGGVELLVQRVDEVTAYVHERQAAQLEDATGRQWRSRAEEVEAELYARSTEIQAAREAEQRTARVLEAMPSGFLSLDTEWRFILLNPAAEQLLGRPRGELIGRRIWDAFPDTVGNEFEAAYRAAVDTGVAQTLEAYYPAPLDTWFEVLCWPNPDGLSLYFADVTARRRSAEQAERSTARLALLARVNADLVAAPDVLGTVAGLPALLVPLLADGCTVTLADGVGRAGDVGRPGAVDDGTPVEEAVTRVPDTGVPQQLTGVPPGAGWTVQLPIRGRGRVLGVLTLVGSAGRVRAADDESTAQDIADRVGLALDNARLTNAQAQLAEGLQRSLLTDPPEPDHAQVVVRYLPAAEAAQVGGDWYDAFLQPGGATMLVIGDVAGHDTAAAAAMGQLRGLLRGIAVYSGAGPAEVLRGLDAAMESLMLRTLATAAIARFEQSDEEHAQGLTRMVWSNAGHPPPLVLSSDGTVAVQTARRVDLLLGVDPGTRREEHVATLGRDATVLLYTDGLIERRDATLDEGIDRLVSVVAELAGSDLDVLCDGVLERMVHGRPDDDVVLVAVRLHRQDRPRPPVAGPDVVPAPAPPGR
ncbi:SpoIIE family protein phosphatase [Geodermatophilus sp. DSM 45219]|uniref:SpoIIE family protein phosphatase n=1 Tax=Geodermatophilus sp. DSM 45219 TaxID=1881103 RepID=UPI0008874FC8|nr:SpoIIE family protein phosphatase [Geodermatophilus sp. DSM 45219]SDN71094.1 PAS domain S-box-containing protein [Geodermatophilus sp. DSM 45219]